MKESSTAADLLRQIKDSRGSGYLNRTHQRSFSLNVFQMNAVELMEAAQRVKDPDQGMALMMEKNREAGRQAPGASRAKPSRPQLRFIRLDAR